VQRRKPKKAANLGTVIRFENVTKVYSTYGRRRTILDRVNFTLKPGISYRPW
jgi:ABC-type multidrug transport system ATPase subunit